MFHVKHRQKAKKIAIDKMMSGVFRQYRHQVKKLADFYKKKFWFLMEIRSIGKHKRARYDFYIRFTEQDGEQICAHVSANFKRAYNNCRLDLAENVAPLN